MKSVPKPLVLTNQWMIVFSVTIALIFQSAWILLFPLFSIALGLATGINPVLAAAKRFLRKSPDQYIQEDYSQLQFNQWMAAGFLSVACISYFMKWAILFNIATLMVGMAALIAILGFCIGCFIRFQFQQWMYRRRRKSADYTKNLKR